MAAAQGFAAPAASKQSSSVNKPASGKTAKVVGGPVTAVLEFRTWTSAKGNKLEAMMVDGAGKQVVLEDKGGVRKTVAIASLSQEDQDYIKQNARKLKEAIPASIKVELARRSRDNPGVKMDFVLVKQGEFTMGDGQFADSPPHKVKITRPFYIGKFEVTVAQWTVFADATKYKTLAEQKNHGWGYKDGQIGHADGLTWRTVNFKQGPDHPVVLINWYDAQEFCKWASKETGKTIRLATEAEWEYAARGPESLVWPWGNKEDLARFNQADASFKKAGIGDNQWTQFGDDGFAFTAPVGSYSNASWCGAYDMSGNAREWVQDVYTPDYYRSSPEVDPPGPAAGDLRARRGGSWNQHFYFGISARRDEHPGTDANDNLGFRCAVSL